MQGRSASAGVIAMQSLPLKWAQATLVVMQTSQTPRRMSSITIRKLDPALKDRLRVRAAEHGHSMEAEVRDILQATLQGPAPARTLYERIRALVEPVGGIDLDLPPREPARDPPNFE